MSDSDKQYTPYQKGVIRRYYENRETMSTQKLGELVSELYLCTSEKKAEKLWERAHKALVAAGANKVWLENVVAKRDLEGLAKIVKELF